jgi:hypothetical protein
MKIYPNPSRSKTYISVPEELKSGGTLTIKNKKGIVISEQAYARVESQLIPLDMSSQPYGIYEITLENEGHTASNDLINLGNLN